MTALQWFGVVIIVVNVGLAFVVAYNEGRLRELRKRLDDD